MTNLGFVLNMAGMDWAERARCANREIVPDPEIFFVSDSNEVDRDTPQAREARAVCHACPVFDDCRSYADAQPEPPHGMWGGKFAKERRMRDRNRGDGSGC